MYLGLYIRFPQPFLIRVMLEYRTKDKICHNTIYSQVFSCSMPMITCKHYIAWQYLLASIYHTSVIACKKYLACVAHVLKSNPWVVFKHTDNHKYGYKFSHELYNIRTYVITTACCSFTNHPSTTLSYMNIVLIMGFCCKEFNLMIYSLCSIINCNYFYPWHFVTDTILISK